jgi:outer membrane protein OmpA-like peptidoglycan-associated protein
MKIPFILFSVVGMTWCTLQAQEVNLLAYARQSDIYQIEIQAADGVNTSALEFSPVYFRDGLVFVYANPKKAIKKDKEINAAPFGLYYAVFDSVGMPQKPVLFSNAISSDFHLGPAAFNKAQDLLLFSRNDIPSVLPKGSKRQGQDYRAVQKLYQADLGPSDWINITPMPFNSDTFYVFHPSLSSDGKRIYFTSNMPGGFGDADIYYVERIGQDWSPPINAGPEINTAGKEAYPCMHANGDLYFASNGHAGLGGFDIFVSRPNGRKWSKPVNLGEPINSKQDDFGVCIIPNGHEGFFTSNRTGGKGKDDLYRFRLKLRDDLPYQQLQVAVLDKQERKRIDSAEIRVFELQAGGMPHIHAPFYADREGEGSPLVYRFKESSTAWKAADRITDFQGNALLDLYKSKRYVLIATKEGFKPFIKGVDVGAEELRIELEREYKKPCLRASCLVLDKNTRLQIKDATVAVLERETREGVAFRTEDSGTFSLCIDLDKKYEVHISRQGYNPGVFPMSSQTNAADSVVEFTFELDRFSGGAPKTDASIREQGTVAEGKTLVLNNIYYDYNQFNIRKDATAELDELAVIMDENPSMEIELIAHTDSRGDWLYNQKLSLQRALAAKDFLVSKGIRPDRIKALGYGESQIRNHCFDGVPCSDEDHQYNRRTEVRIIRLNEPGKPEIKLEKSAAPDEKGQ